MEKETAQGCLFGVALVLAITLLVALNSIDDHLVAILNAIREHH